jgi:hypothetical protein
LTGLADLFFRRAEILPQYWGKNDLHVGVDRKAVHYSIMIKVHVFVCHFGFSGQFKPFNKLRKYKGKKIVSLAYTKS